MKIISKSEYGKLAHLGHLGNTFRLWDTVEEAQRDGYRGWVTIRSRRASDRKLFVPHVKLSDLRVNADNELYIQLDDHYYAPISAVYIQECPSPDTERIVNFEAAHLIGGLHLTYAPNDPRPLRVSLEDSGLSCRGVDAYGVLRRYVGDDYDTLADIWETYPDAVIEGSVFGRATGRFNQKLIVWEVRDF